MYALFVAEADSYGNIYRDSMVSCLSSILQHSYFNKNRLNNFAHPAIVELCEKVFYRKGGITRAPLYDRFFSTSVPHGAILLISVIVSSSICGLAVLITFKDFMCFVRVVEWKARDAGI